MMLKPFTWLKKIFKQGKKLRDPNEEPLSPEGAFGIFYTLKYYFLTS
jgi:hypothetical protein